MAIKKGLPPGKLRTLASIAPLLVGAAGGAYVGRRTADFINRYDRLEHLTEAQALSPKEQGLRKRERALKNILAGTSGGGIGAIVTMARSEVDPSIRAEYKTMKLNLNRLGMPKSEQLRFLTKVRTRTLGKLLKTSVPVGALFGLGTFMLAPKGPKGLKSKVHQAVHVRAYKGRKRTNKAMYSFERRSI
jgi:hypothetical protein